MLSLPRALACTAALAVATEPTTARAVDPLQAAVVQEDIAPWIGVPLAGNGSRRMPLPDLLGLYPYAYWLEPSVGQIDPIQVKVLLLKQGSARLIFVALDVIGVSRHLRDQIAGETDYGRDEILVSATHTHSGPGALEDYPMFELTVTDRFHKGVFDAFMAHVVNAVRTAESSLVDAELSAFGFDAIGLQENRRDHLPGHFDPRANVLLVRAKSGEWLGALINFAIHGTAYSGSNLSFSADVPGAIAESFGVLLGSKNSPAEILPVLFLNGAQGDVRPTEVPPGTPAEHIARIAAAFSLQAGSAFSTASPVADGFSVRNRSVNVGIPFAYIEPFKDRFPPAALLPGIGLSLNGWLRHFADIWSIKIGGLRMLTWPGEPTTDLGLAARSLCAATGAQQVWNISLTNDHLGYFVTPEAFEAGGYEASSTRFGPNAGRKLVKEHCQLMSAP